MRLTANETDQYCVATRRFGVSIPTTGSEQNIIMHAGLLFAKIEICRVSEQSVRLYLSL
jgi:hypothetical protein